MPRDTAQAGLPARRDYSPALPGDFMDKAGVLGAMVDQIGEAMERQPKTAAQICAEAFRNGAYDPDRQGDYWQQRRADIWAVAQNVRQALTDTLQDDFTDEQVTGAASIIIDYPESWRDYSPIDHGTPPCLSAYKSALDEIEEPALTVKRLERHAGWKFDAASKHLDAAKEAVGRFSWASVTPEQARASFNAAMTCAQREFDAGAALMASAEGFRAKLAEVV